MKTFGLPRPHCVGKVRTMLNEDISRYFGEYFHIEGTMPYEKQKKKDHGGQVHLKKDHVLSRGTGDVLQDVSMGGAKARRFLSNHDNKQVNAMWNCWRKRHHILFGKLYTLNLTIL